jgi:hypothetical protein
MDGGGLNGQGISVAQPQFLEALKQSTIHQDVERINFQQEFRTGYRTCAAQAFDLDIQWA